MNNPFSHTILKPSYGLALLAILGSTAFCSAASAQSDVSYVCTLNSATRTISVNYTEQKALPCRVEYQKDFDTQTLWQASHTPGYCEQKAEEFVAKQRAWGWDCVNENTSGIAVETID